MKGTERIKRFNTEVEQLKESELLKFEHTFRVIPIEEIMRERSNAYDFLV